MKYFAYKALITTYLLAVFFSACHSGSDKQTVSEERKDTLSIHDEIVRKVASSLQEEALPFTADSVLFFQLTKYDSLGEKDVKALAGRWFKHDLVSSIEYQLSEFYKIDSIKAAGHYAQWCETLDIGMTKFANAYAICKLKIDSNTLALVWATYISSYEACPSSTSYTIYFTLIYKGNTGESFMLGQYTAAADAPASMERTLTGKLVANGTFEMNAIETQRDADDSLIEATVNKEQYSFAIQDGLIKLVTEKKDSPQIIKKRE